MAEPKFEKDLEKLEKIVSALEEGGLPLDESLKRFEEGIKLARRCDKALTEAEKKIEVLVKNAEGDLKAEPFGDEDGDEKSADAGEADSEAQPKDGQQTEEEDGEDGGMLF